jgi:DNA-binding NarL/FixJ family response regulator
MVVREVSVLKVLNVFIADDSEIIQQQLQSAISLIDGCKLIGTAGSDSNAIGPIRTLQPDFVILDISMPHREGIRVLREIRKAVPLAQIAIFTADPSVVLQEVCLEAGANFYLDKSQIQDLIDIVSAQVVHTMH